MSNSAIGKLTNMQNYRTKHLAEIAIAYLSAPVESPKHLALPRSPITSSHEGRSLIKMETPTPLSREDRQTLSAPIEKANAIAWPTLDQSMNTTWSESISPYQDLGDIMHQAAVIGNDDPTLEPILSSTNREEQGDDVEMQYPILLADPTLETAPVSFKAEGKRRVTSAGKDEWSDSSDDEEVVRVHDPEITTSEHFQSETSSGMAQPPHKRAKTARNKTDPRYNLMSRTNQKVAVSTKSYSMSKSAVDYRGRKQVERDYKDKVCAFIDQDILDRVDSEGGITPEGRVYKAVYEMMEREQRQGGQQQVVTPPTSSPESSSSDEVARLREEVQKLRRQIGVASKALGSA